MSKATLDRRQLIGSAALVAALAAAPFYLKLRETSPETGMASDAQIGMLRRVVDAVIPRTDTPGAVDVGVHDFVALALAHGLEGTRGPAGSSQPNLPRERSFPPPAGLQLLDWLGDQLRREGVRDPAAAPAAVDRAVAAIDARAYAPGGEESPWHKLKALILLGYYTSEAGASRELRYELVPGRWDPDLPSPPGTRAWSSDWTALTFG